MKTKMIILALLSLFIQQAQAQQHTTAYRYDRYNSYNVIQVMHPYDFDMLYSTVARQPNDNRKMSAIYHALSVNAMTSQQISRLLTLLRFEKNKLEVGKAAWLKVYDPGNYYRVLNEFTFSSTVREMHEFMSAHPRVANHQIVQPHPVRYIAQAVPMHPGAFNEAKRTISAQRFEDSKLQVAKQVAMSNNLTSQQVAELMSLFSFESTRVEFAIFAYRFVFDPGNYFLTYRSFRFDSSVRELNYALYGRP